MSKGERRRGGDKDGTETREAKRKSMLFHGQRTRKHCPGRGITMCNGCVPGGEERVEEGMPCHGRQEVKEFEGSVIQPLQFVR